MNEFFEDCLLEIKPQDWAEIEKSLGRLNNEKFRLSKILRAKTST